MGNAVSAFYYAKLYCHWVNYGDINKLKVLVGCEFSHEVARAFRRLGHFAISCDTLPVEDSAHKHWHIEGDINDVLGAGFWWDLIILHPPCTALCVSGNRWYGQGQAKHNERLKALKWTAELWHKAKQCAPHVALENPVGVLNKYGNHFPKPAYVQPYEFGHVEQNKTGLWLHALPPLQPTNNVYEAMMELPVLERQRIWAMSPSADRGKERSRTYPGIAKAMAEQWGEFVLACNHERTKAWTENQEFV